MSPSEKPSLTPDQIEEHVGGIDYPIHKQDLKDQAQDRNAPYYVVEIIEQMPDRQYKGATDVAEGIGEVNR